MKFDRPNDPQPLTIGCAIRRGWLCVNLPLLLIMFIGLILGLFVMMLSLAAGCVLLVLSFVGAWLWWSYTIPQWRAWALRNGVDPIELHQRAIEALLEWPKGSIFSRTEIRRDRR